MKVIYLTIFLLSVRIACYAQIRGGKDIPGPITVLDSIKVSVGDTLRMGQGSNANKDFLYFFYSFSGQLYAAPSSYANRSVIIRSLKETTDKLGEKKYYAITRLTGIVNWGIDIISAIRYGEVIGINKIKFQDSKAAAVIQNKPDVTDQLIKLKKLLDEGVLSKEEFEAQKKKILNNN